jgi:hypothetical protein
VNLYAYDTQEDSKRLAAVVLGSDAEDWAGRRAFKSLGEVMFGCLGMGCGLRLCQSGR